MKSKPKTTMKLKTLFTTLFCGASILLIQISPAQTPAASPSPIPSASSPVSAKAGHHRAGRKLKRQLKSLDLTKDQRAQVKAIFKAAKPQIKALRDNATLSEAEKHAQKKAIRTANLAQVRAILTADQQSKLDNMLTKSKRHGGRN